MARPEAARQGILARAGQGGPWLPARVETAPGPERLVVGDIRARFVREARLVDAEVMEFDEEEAALSGLENLVKGRSVFAWKAPYLPPSAWALAGSCSSSLHENPGPQARAAEIGLTGADWAVAETGSLVMVAGEGRPREASLVNRTHIALLRPSQILPDLDAAMAKIQGLAQAPAQVNFITGPSRTADIEMTLTKGVHGPARVIVLLAPWGN